jgi:hypothetical protein
VIFLYGATSFLGAALLFLVEPMLAKLVLPSFGGSPMVWNTCTLFFQVLLLAGYAYVHVSTRRLGARRQPWLHLGLLVLPLAALPVALPDDTAPGPDTEPTLWLLRVLLLAAGLPFALLATTGPLLQRWFSWTGHARADDPYFLYAASNAGSVVGLLGYPFLVEPTVGLQAQARWWSLAYVGFALLVAACGLVALRASRRPVSRVAPAPVVEAAVPEAAPGLRQKLLWVGVAFVPASLMLGVTTHVSTDIAAIPLFWTVPLAIYLATFVVAFGRRTRRPPKGVALLATALAIPVLLGLTDVLEFNVWQFVALDLALLTTAGLAAHGLLAAQRPAVEHLTGFYLLVSLGGALGGLLNGLVAPVVFDRPWEYPLVLGLVPMLFVAAAGRRLSWRLAVEPLALVSLLLVAGFVGTELLGDSSLARERTFFGSYKIVNARDSTVLVHGTTYHGWQQHDPEQSQQPTSYYSRSGPVGDIVTAYDDRGLMDRIAVIGMGVGTMAYYGQPGGRLDFYEIDPAVVRFATRSGYFDFVERSEATVRVRLGDGRLTLAEAPARSYGFIAVDAFSSDAIPAHLLTTEALRTYRSRLARHGLLAIHVTNRHLELAPVVAAQARELDMAVVQRYDSSARSPAAVSHWLVLAREPADLELLRGMDGWEPVPVDGTRAWTDDYSSLVEVLDVG